ncbi:LOW QUALITY PROTEIN: hypothetical protein ACHAW6_003006 [Cyclotella cf. meneghiniana]
MIIISVISHPSLRHFNLVMAYTQSPIETDLYMAVPHGIETIEGNTKDYVLKLLANIHGQKQAARVRTQYLLESIGFTQSCIDEYVFYRDEIIFIIYLDDGIFLGTSDDQLSYIIKEFTDIGLQIKDQGHLADYVGVNIKWLPDGSYKFSQQTLIDSIIANMGVTFQDFTKPVPAKCTLRLHTFLALPPFQEEWNYRSAVGKLKYHGQMS